MKNLFLFCAMLIAVTQLTSQNLDVSGNAKIDGLLDIKVGDSSSVAIGVGAGSLYPDNGSQNLAIGVGAGTYDYGSNNVYVGHDAGYYAGFQLFASRKDSNNTSVGQHSGYLLAGDDNAFYGKSSGEMTQSGFNNTFLGSHAGYLNKNGDCNIYVGHKSGRNLNEDSSNNIDIACRPDGILLLKKDLNNTVTIGNNTLVNESNKIVLGNLAIEEIEMANNVSVLSDGRFKNDIKDNVGGLDFILGLKPVTYKLNFESVHKSLVGNDAQVRNSKHEPISKNMEMYLQRLKEKSKKTHSGFIAQDVAKLAKECHYDFSGIIKPSSDQDYYSMRYAEFVVPLVKAVQEQQNQIEKRDKRVAILSSEVQLLKDQIKRLTKYMDLNKTK